MARKNTHEISNKVQILLKLLEGDMYISELSRALGYDRHALTDQLKLLQKGGYVRGHYEVGEDGGIRGRAILIYQPTDKARREIATLKGIMVYHLPPPPSLL